jgi:hypothetical protein
MVDLLKRLFKNVMTPFHGADNLLCTFRLAEQDARPLVGIMDFGTTKAMARNSIGQFSKAMTASIWTLVIDYPSR